MPQLSDIPPKPPCVSVIIASLGRPEALAYLLGALEAQSQPAEEIILSVTDSKDLPAGLADRPGLKLRLGPKGLCAQRNTALPIVCRRAIW